MRYVLSALRQFFEKKGDDGARLRVVFEEEVRAVDFLLKKEARAADDFLLRKSPRIYRFSFEEEARAADFLFGKEPANLPIFF